MAAILWLMGMGLFAAGISMSGSIALFIDLPSVAIVLGGTLFFWMAYHRPAGVITAVRAALGSDGLSADEISGHHTVLATGRTLAVGSGIVGLLIGLVSMLASMDDPTAIGPAMAVALLTMFYAVILSEVCIGPLMNRLSARTGSEGNQKSPVGPSAIAIVAAPFALLSFFVMMLSFKDLT